MRVELPAFKQFLTKDDCDSLVTSFESYIQSEGAKIWIDDASSDIRVFHAEKRIPAFKFLHDQMVEYYKERTSYYPDYSFLMVNRVVARDGNLGSGGGWHRDSWLKQHKVFVFLTDVSNKSGPLEFASNSFGFISRVYHLISGRRSLRKSKLSGLDGGAIPICVSAGKGFFLDTTCLHRGRPILEGFRIAATLYAFNHNKRKISKIIKRFDML